MSPTEAEFECQLADAQARIREMIHEIDRRDDLIADLQRQLSEAQQRIASELAARAEDDERMEALVDWPPVPSREWSRGFLAGIFDAEGTLTCSEALRITNTDPAILQETTRCLQLFGFDCVLEPGRVSRPASDIRVRGGLKEHLRFFHTMDPSIRRKCDLEHVAIKGKSKLRVVSIEKLGFDMLMFDITTGTGDFIANGVVSHNCYARPSHEYLSLGAGSDFERKIVVKKNAAELLREAFDKPKWKGERVVFSGVTDCYQPLERKLEITRACLQVCIDYKNPAVSGTRPFFALYQLGSIVFAGAGDYDDATRTRLNAQRSWYGYPANEAHLAKANVTRANFPALAAYRNDSRTMLLRVGCYRRNTAPCQVGPGDPSCYPAWPGCIRTRAA